MIFTCRLYIIFQVDIHFRALYRFRNEFSPTLSLVYILSLSHFQTLCSSHIPCFFISFLLFRRRHNTTVSPRIYRQSIAISNSSLRSSFILTFLFILLQHATDILHPMFNVFLYYYCCCYSLVCIFFDSFRLPQNNILNHMTFIPSQEKIQFNAAASYSYTNFTYIHIYFDLSRVSKHIS